MPVKIKLPDLGKVVPLKSVRASFAKEAAEPGGILAQLVALIQRGISPVAGWGKYRVYSQSYAQAMGYKKTASVGKSGRAKAKFSGSGGGTIRGTDGSKVTGKKVTPVNLTASGTMLASGYGTASQDKATLSFRSKFAGYHNDGIKTKAGVVRRPLIPSKPGEDFSRDISKALRILAAKIVAEYLKKK